MTLGSESKTHEWKSKMGPEGSEDEFPVSGFSLSYNSDVVPLYELDGNRTPSSLKEGNINISGSIRRAVKDDRLLGELLGSLNIINFVGINNGGSSHTIFEKAAATTTQAPGSWSGSEIANGDYDNLEADDSNQHAIAATTNTHKASSLIKFDNIAASEGAIQFVTFELVGHAVAESGTDGFNVYVWDDTNTAWVLVGSSDAAAAQGSVVVTISSPGDFIDSNVDMFFRVETQGTDTGSAGTTEMRIDYVELRTNLTADSNNLQEDFGLELLGSNSSGTITLTLAGVKFNQYDLEVGDDGSTVFETLTFLAKTLSQAQT